jgi:hypothetical protein
MLPQNHRVTDIIAKLPVHSQDMAYRSDYFQSLTLEQQESFRQLVGLHLRAIWDFQQFNLSQADNSFTPTAILQQQAEAERKAAESRNIHIYVHHRRSYALWYDWWIFNHSFHHCYHAPVSYSSNSHKSKEEDKSNPALVLLAGVMVGAAIIASLYTAIEAGRCIDQLAHAEDIFGNITKLVFTALGGSFGVGFGLFAGAALFEAPVIGALVGCLIVSGIAIAAAKKLVEHINSDANYDSALAYDPRFCLSNKEADHLRAQGYDVRAVSEALREIAIAYDKAHKDAISLCFWSASNKDKAILIDLMREVKAGFPSHQFVFNNKLFNFAPPTVAMQNEPVLGVVLDTYGAVSY